jgi:ketosteroid isomerase-like protein
VLKLLKILLVFFTITACLAPWAHAAPDDTAQIRALEGRLAAAATARNIDAIMKAYSPDETLFVFDVIPPRQYVGAKALRKDWEDFLAGSKGPLTYTITDLDVAVDCRNRYQRQSDRSDDTGDRCLSPAEGRLGQTIGSIKRGRKASKTDFPHLA